MTNIQPVSTKILVKFTKVTNLSLPSGVTDPIPDVRVVAIGPDVTCCQIGDKLLTRQDINVIPIGGDDKIAFCIIDASGIIAIEREADVALTA